MDGTFWGIMAESMMFPAGFLIFIFLSRWLGPEKYGIYVLTINLVIFLEWVIVSFFDRATIKLTNESEDWESLGTTVLQLQFLVSLLVALSVILGAAPVARALHEPALAGTLRLMAVDIPLASLAHTHKYLLIGVGNYRQKALSASGRWFGKLCLVVLLVSMGFSIQGAIWGNIGASLIELLIGRRFIRPAFFRRWNIPFRRLLIHAAPLFLLAISLRLYNKMDLFLLKYLGGTAIQAGLYSAAQSLSLPLAVISGTMNPVLLSTLTRECHLGNWLVAREISCAALRIIFLSFPFVLVTALSSGAWVSVILGKAYQSAAVPFSALIFSAAFLLIISVCMTILIAAGKVIWTLPLIGFLIPPALIGYWLFIPEWGMIGAAFVNSGVALLTAMIALGLICRLWKNALPLKTIAKTLFIMGILLLLFIWNPVREIHATVRLIFDCLLILAFYYGSGEITKRDFQWLKEMWNRKSSG